MAASKIFMEQAENAKRSAQSRRLQGDERGAKFYDDQVVIYMQQSAIASADEMRKINRDQKYIIQKHQYDTECYQIKSNKVKYQNINNYDYDTNVQKFFTSKISTVVISIVFLFGSIFIVNTLVNMGLF